MCWTGAETSFSQGFAALTTDAIRVSYLPDGGLTRINLVEHTHYAVALDGSGLVTVTPLALPAAPGTLTFLRHLGAARRRELRCIQCRSRTVHRNVSIECQRNSRAQVK